MNKPRFATIASLLALTTATSVVPAWADMLCKFPGRGEIRLTDTTRGQAVDQAGTRFQKFVEREGSVLMTQFVAKTADGEISIMIGADTGRPERGTQHIAYLDQMGATRRKAQGYCFQIDGAKP